MKIAISAEKGETDSFVDIRFGRAKWFLIYDEDQDCWEVIENKQNMQATQGAGIQSASRVVNSGCEVLISGHCGPKAFAVLSKAAVEVYITGRSTVTQAITAYYGGMLERLEKADVIGHW